MANDSSPPGLPPPPGGYLLYPAGYVPPPPPGGMPRGVPEGPGMPVYGHGGDVRPGVIRQQNPVLVVALSVCTCGLYSAFWLYRITRELKQALNESDLSPGSDLVLSVLSCGLWAIYAQYRNAQLVYRGLTRFDPRARDQSAAVLFLNVAAIVVLVTWPIALFILQQEMNRLGRFAEGRA